MSAFDDSSILMGKHIAVIEKIESMVTRLEDRITKLETAQNRAWGVLLGVAAIAGVFGANLKQLLKIFP